MNRLRATSIGLLSLLLPSCDNADETKKGTGLGDIYSFETTEWEWKYHSAASNTPYGSYITDIWHNAERGIGLEVSVVTRGFPSWLPEEQEPGLFQASYESKLQSSSALMAPEALEIEGGDGRWFGYILRDSVNGSFMANVYLSAFIEGEINFGIRLDGNSLTKEEALLILGLPLSVWVI